MEKRVPRILLAGTNSGCGKTTVSCAVMQALVNRNLNVGAFKCGPDYIDPMFHSKVIGAKSSNLDLFLFDENTLKNLLVKNGESCDISVLEGVMGYYDGRNLTNTDKSTYNVSCVTNTPTVLVVGAKGVSLSVLATIQGFLSFREDNNIVGVILNNCHKTTYEALAKEIHSYFNGKIKPLGYLPPMPDISLESRHLGLVTAQEISDIKEKMQILAAQASESLDIDGIISIAQSAKNIEYEPIEIKKFEKSVKIAVAMDKAFCFYYQDSLDVLRQMGSEIVYFSPLEDEKLPDNINAVYFGGGYPELYTEKLEANVSMRKSILAVLNSGLPCMAECGGFMYLTKSIGGREMVGFIDGDCTNKQKLVRFGYSVLKADRDNMFCKAGEEIPAHEFHYWDCTDTGADFTSVKSPSRQWKCIFANERLFAGYPHIHFYSNISFAEGFYKAALKEKEKCLK